ncbi:MAG: bifunctional (p)ppGpp synthetase/guanosine-3',5'-bis(diphosphate) 3'-pyrophosphohydrolase [Nitrospirae bacterium]|nr:bifunctional (p)ppGpp synthetase/guanosine-3',5'-bis(diphosphate) 3'-pyrophosphohydrolase [Nitrospirota bacterium]
MARSEEIAEKIHTYHPEVETGLFRRAYEFSSKMHRGQTRLSGEPYLSHPLEVAAILTELKLDMTTIVAGLLHDILEDTPVKPEQLRVLFGEEVAFLVEGLTKISRMEFKTRVEAQAENFRKMILAMAKDIRIILIKLADRLHNMRTLHYLPPQRQREIAQETLDIYAPLANRMGIAWLKWELEDLAFRTLQSEICLELEQKVAKRREDRENYIRELLGIVKGKLEEFGFKGEVKGRPKHYFSIWQKMRKQGISFEEVYDLIAIRITTDTKMNCYAILGLIHSLWTPVPGRFKDYIAVPKSNLYQSLHTTVIGPKGERVEFQIRTEEMHRVAEEGIAAHWKYKEKQVLGEKAEAQFAWLRQLLEWQRDLPDAREFMETVKVDLFPDAVYALTPKGDVKELPKGSTPIDFAYSIHSDVGNQCVAAKVNGKIVPLKYELKTGDIVAIQAQPGHVPSRDWLKIVKTSRARQRIKHWIKTEERKHSTQLGAELLDRELRRADLSLGRFQKSEELHRVAQEMSLSTGEDLLAAIGYGKVSALQVAHRLLPEESRFRAREEQRPLKRPAQEVKSVRLGSIDQVLLHYAKCCGPLPGDPIVGFVTRGRGLTVHQADCPNLAHPAFDRERMVQVDWDRVERSPRPVRITVRTVDRPGMLAGVSAAITAMEANISQAEVSTTEDRRAQCHFMVEVLDVQHLNRVMRKIQDVDGVLSVRRTPAA